MPRELLCRVTIKDCDVQTFAAGGPGGQNQNKRHTGVRIIHRASGAVGESREHREQLQNKRAAFRRMGESVAFRRWLDGLIADVEHPSQGSYTSIERIRTYNFIERYAKDHRTGKRADIKRIMEGDLDALR